MVRFARYFLLMVVLATVTAINADNGPQHQAAQTPPVKLGTSGGNINDHSNAFCCSGTLGSLVQKGGVQYVLSNDHVLGRSDQAVDGEDVSQPGLIDNSCRPGTIVADYSKANSGTLGTNIDAALATVRSGQVTSTGEILDVGVPSSTIAAAAVNQGVAKSGRTTGLTCASVGSTNTSVKVQYQQGCNQGKKFTITYTNQVVVNSSSFSAGGDSGSLIVTSAGAQPVALLFAGSSSTTIGNPMTEVSSKLGFTMVGGNTHSVTCTSGGGGPKPRGASVPQEAIDRVAAIKEHYARGLMRDPAVLGVGVGADPNNPDQAAIIVYVDQHQPLARPIPQQIESANTVIYRTDTIRAYGWNETASTQPRSCSAK